MVLLQLFDNPQKYLWLGGSFIASIIATVSAFSFGIRYAKKKTKLILVIFISMLFLTIAIYADWITLILDSLYELPGPYGIFDIATVISFGCNIIANILLLRFIELIFYENKKRGARWILFIMEGIALPIVVGTFLLVMKDEQLIGLGLHIVASVVIYASLYWNSRVLRKKLAKEDSKDVVAYKSIKLMGLSGVSLFFSLFLFVGHEVYLMIRPLFGWNNEYITLSIGWLFAGTAAALVYLGFIVPEWYKKRLRKE